MYRPALIPSLSGPALPRAALAASLGGISWFAPLENDSSSPTPPASTGSPAPPSRPRWPLWLGIGAAAVALAVVAFLASRDRPVVLAGNPPPDVRTAQAHAGTLERTLRLSGSTVGENSVTLRAPYMRGRRTRGGGAGDFHLVLKDLIDQGSRVSKGDILATFDRQAMLDRLDTLRAETAQDENTLKSLRAKLLADREAHDQQIRVQKAAMEAAQLDLQTAPVRSAIQADLFRLALDEARAQYNQLVAEKPDLEASQNAQIRIAELEVQDSQLEVRRAETSAERMVVRAPRAGLIVISQTARNGQLDTIRAGDELRPGQPFLDIVAPGDMLVEAKANQVDVTQLRIGAPAEVVPEAFPDIHLPARVFAVGSMAVSDGWRASYVREVPVYLRIKGSDPRLIPSLTVSVDVQVARVDDTTVIPMEAVFSRPADPKPFALVRANGGWSKRDLDLGLAANTKVAVRSGIENGETVATQYPADYQD